MRVFIIDKHVLFRRCMLAYLQEYKDLSVVGETESLESAIEILKTGELQPDIFLVDTDLSNQDGAELLVRLQTIATKAIIVILSEIPVEEQIVQAIKLGAGGYLGKDIEPETLIEALHRIFNGEKIFPQYLLIKQIESSSEDSESFSKSAKAKSAKDINLTKRELEVLQLVTHGLMDKQIAEKLLVSENTVKNHMKSIRRKFGVSNRLQATLAGIKLGVTPQPVVTTNT